MQEWKKLGLIFNVNKNFDWMYSHASVPFIQYLEDDLFKIYFSSRNKNNESSIGYIIFDLNNPNNILEISSKPILTKEAWEDFKKKVENVE